MPAWRSYRRQTFALQPHNKDCWGSCVSAGFDVGDRGASGLDSWCLSSGVKWKLCSHSHTPRTNLVAEAEVCWSEEIRGPLLRSKKTALYKGRTGPWWPKREGPHLIINVDTHPQASVGGSVWANVVPMSWGGCRDQSGVKKETRWSAKGNRRPRRTVLNEGLTLGSSSGHTHTFLHSVCLRRSCLKHPVFLYGLPDVMLCR